MKLQHSLRNLFLFIGLCFSFNVFSQSKAEKLFDKALEHFHASDFKKAVKLANKSISQDSSLTKAYILLANIHEENEDILNAMKNYDLALGFYDPSFIESYIHNLELKLNTRKYESLIDQSFLLLNRRNIDAELVNKISYLRDLAEFRKTAIENPVSFDYELLDSSINTSSDEYIDGFYTDNEHILFTRKSRSDKRTTGNFNEQLFLTYLNDSLNKIIFKEFIGKELNQRIGAASVSINNRYLVFTACYRDDGYGNCDLYYIDLWKEPRVAKNMGHKINSEYWESQPFFSPDGKYLYFSSKRPGGSGGSDFWRCRLDENGNWRPAKNLGRSVNTAKDEMSLFIHPNNETVYFASNGHIGMGGFDIFEAKLKGNKISEIRNLGYPINTETDQTNFILSDNGKTAFMSSQFESSDHLDITKINTPKNPDFKSITTRTLFFSDSKSNEIILVNKEEIELRNQENLPENDKLIPTHDPAYFELKSISNQYQLLSVNRPGYIYVGYGIDFDSNLKDTIMIPLDKLEVGKSIYIQDVLYDTDQYEILAETNYIVHNIVVFLKNNPSVNVEIEGHTDDIGDSNYNQILSEKRAKAVYDYLITNGISANRLKYIGYGETRPLFINSSELNRAANRRTVITIIGI